MLLVDWALCLQLLLHAIELCLKLAIGGCLLCQLSADLYRKLSPGCLHMYCSLPLNLESGLLSLGQALLQPLLLAGGRTRQARAWHQQLAGCAAVACEVSSTKAAGILVVGSIFTQSTLYLLPSS